MFIKKQDLIDILQGLEDEAQAELEHYAPLGTRYTAGVHAIVRVSEGAVIAAQAHAYCSIKERLEKLQEPAATEAPAAPRPTASPARTGWAE